MTSRRKLSIQGGIFDLDGTLLDSMPAWDTLGESYLRLHGITPRAGLSDATRAMTLRQSAEYYRTEYGIDHAIDEIKADISAMIEDFYMNRVQPKAGAPELLAALSDRGVRMCIATATEKQLAEATLSRLGLLGYFECVVTNDGFKAGKNRPEIFEHALSALGTQKALTYVFEDAPHAVATAKAAGFPVVAVHDASYAESERELRGLADLYVHSLTELEGCFDGAE